MIFIPGGNPPMRPDQLLQPDTRAGTGPAPQSVVVAHFVILTGSGSAIVFVLPGDVFHGGIVPTAPVGGPSGVPGAIFLSGTDVASGTNDSQAAVGVVGRSADSTRGPFTWIGSIQQGSSNIEPSTTIIVGSFGFTQGGVPGGNLNVTEWVFLAPSGDTTGVTDLAKINSYLAAGVAIQLMPGAVYHINGPIIWQTGSILVGLYAGSYPTSGAIPTVAVIHRVALVNQDMIQVPDGTNYGLLQGIAFDGNRTNNTTGIGVNIQDGATGKECQLIIDRCYIHDNPDSNVYLGNNRRANKILNSVLYRSANGDGVTVAGSDNTIDNCIIGSNGRGGVVLGTTITQNWAATTGFPCTVAHVYNNDIFGNTVGVALAQSASDCIIAQNGIDRHSLQGLTVYDGASSSIEANSFHSNGTSANNTYGHVDLAAGVTGVTMNGNNFGPQDSGVTNVASFCVVTESGIAPGAINGGIGTFDSTSSVGGLISTAGANVSPSIMLSRGGATIRNAQASMHLFQLQNHSGTTVFDMTDAGTFTVNSGIGKFLAGIAGGDGHAAQAITANGQTISSTGATFLPVNPNAAYTGTILQAASNDGTFVAVTNVAAAGSGFTVTFAVAATSNVALGASVSITPGNSMLFWWDAATSLWYSQQ